MGVQPSTKAPGERVLAASPTAPVESASLAAGAVLRDLFLSNADRGDNAANDHLVAELARRIRARQGCGDDSRSQHPPSHPASPTPAGGGCHG